LHFSFVRSRVRTAAPVNKATAADGAGHCDGLYRGEVGARRRRQSRQRRRPPYGRLARRM